LIAVGLDVMTASQILDKRRMDVGELIWPAALVVGWWVEAELGEQASEVLYSLTCVMN
jgi:hypothetical protein